MSISVGDKVRANQFSYESRFGQSGVVTKVTRGFVWVKWEKETEGQMTMPYMVSKKES